MVTFFRDVFHRAQGLVCGVAIALMISLLLSACGGNRLRFDKSSQAGPFWEEDLRLLPASDSALRLLEERSARTPMSTILFEETPRPDGTLQIKVIGKGKLIVTTDGSIPNENTVGAGTIIADGNVQFVIQKPTLVRAISFSDGTRSLLRSRAFTPDIVKIEVAQLPREYDVQSVFVTGPFRGWSDSLTAENKLVRQANGSWSLSLKANREKRFVYKFLLLERDGNVVWWANPGKPQTGAGQFTNNYEPTALESLKPLFLTQTSGFIEEAALDLRLQPVAALDRGVNTVRVGLGFLKGDVDSASMLFSDGRTVALKKASVQLGEVDYDRFSGLIQLPVQDVSLGFLIAAEDSGQQILIGRHGILDSRLASVFDQAFPFVYVHASRELNGESIYQIPEWAIDANWYQIFVERFRNGDNSNDQAGPLPYEWQALSGSENPHELLDVRKWTSDWFLFDEKEESLENSVLEHIEGTNRRDVQRFIVINRRYGGDLEGVRQKIQHLKDLGVNAVYFNPVFESDSNHKYDTKDYRHIDRHFGPMRRNLATGEVELFPDDEMILAREDVSDVSTWGFTRADKLFMQLVTELQENGIRVVIDGVFNHSASNSEFMKDVAKRGKQSPYFEWFDMAQRGDEDFESKKCLLSEVFPNLEEFPAANDVAFEAWFGYCTLPNHREGFPETVFHPGFKEYLDRIIERWMEPKVVDGIRFNGIDGFRLDVYGDVSEEYWRIFRKKVKSVKEDALIIAEDWYDGFEILQGDQTDVMMNYTARTLVEGWFINSNRSQRFTPSQTSDYLNFRLNNHRAHVKYGLWTMLESHDTDRIISKAVSVNRGLSPKPQDGNSWDDASVNRPDLGAPYSNEKPGDSDIKVYKSIVAYQTATVGAPLVYYGSEYGMWGSDDPTNRKPMMWPDLFNGRQYESECVTYPGIWCQIQKEVRYPMNPNMDIFNLQRRLLMARQASLVLRRGSLNTEINVEVDGRKWILGKPEADFLFLWGFERNFGDREFAYFVSNQDLDAGQKDLILKTKWTEGERVRELISGFEYVVGPEGWVNLRLDRDEAALLLK